MTTLISSSPKAWPKAIQKAASEFAPTPLPILEGKLPEGLQGTLYRNGPARLERGGERVGHWFDGDGAILAVHFQENEATGVYRYVQTEGYLEEEKANHFLFSNYGMTAAGPFWNTWLKPIKNAANTSVLVLPDKLLALWEGSSPYSLDLETLHTFGEAQLSGLNAGEPFSAHPKVDHDTGEIYNFGVVPGLNVTLNLYKSSPTGKILQRGSAPLNGLPVVHDFALAGQYLVFFVSPVRVNLLLAATGMVSFSDAMEWKPKEGTEILIFDRETLSLVSRGEAEAWYQWHFANGYVNAEGMIVVEFAGYDDFATNQYLKEVRNGETQTFAPASLRKVVVNPQTGKMIQSETLVSRHCEFPVVNPSEVGKPWRYTYLSIQRNGVDIRKEIFGAIARFDHDTDSLTVADCGENRYPSEPIYVHNPHEAGWVLTVVYDGNTDSSEVWVYDEHLNDDPICRLGLPSVIPHSFHGKWKAA